MSREPESPEYRYSLTERLTVEQFVDILQRSGLVERRPVSRRDTVEKMLAGADILVTAWDGDLLVGVSRAVSDFVFCTYLSDLAVDAAHQRRGVGRELIRRTHRAGGRHGTLVLLAGPAAEAYYPHIGMRPHASCWLLRAPSEASQRPSPRPGSCP